MTGHRGCLWSLQVSSRGCTVLLEAEKWVNGPLELADPPQYFFGVAWNPRLEPPNEQSIINVPKIYFRCIRGSKNSQKWEFAPKHLLKSTANGTKAPKTTPMKETLLPCTQGLANTGVPFGLDLPHGPQKYKKTSKFNTFLTLLVFGY